MTDTTPKKEARLCGTRQQSSPAKGQTANRDRIPLCKKDNKILRHLRRDLSGALETVDEILDCDVPRNERAFYVEHLHILLAGVCRIGSSRKIITGALFRAKALEGRR